MGDGAGGSYGEAEERWIGRSQQRGERSTAAREAMKTSTGENPRYARKKKTKKGKKDGGISFVTPETERCQRARPLIDAPPISTCQAGLFFCFFFQWGETCGASESRL